MAWIKLDDNTYAKEASPDPSEIVHLDTLQGEIDNLQTQIDSVPIEKTVPDQETLDFWNIENPFSMDKEMLNQQLSEKQKLLDELKGL